jgi:hypothetical protein
MLRSIRECERPVDVLSAGQPCASSAAFSSLDRGEPAFSPHRLGAFTDLLAAAVIVALLAIALTVPWWAP